MEIDQLLSESVDNMYSLLHLHITELFGDDCFITKLAHSYDATKNVFRFDFSPQGTVVMNLLANANKLLYSIHFSVRTLSFEYEVQNSMNEVCQLDLSVELTTSKSGYLGDAKLIPRILSAIQILLHY